VEPFRQFPVILLEGVDDGVRKTWPHEELSDGELLKLSSKGNEHAFLTLFRRHEGPVFRFALHMSGRRETAEEVTQEVFLTLLSNEKLYAEERGALQGYLIGVARNKVRRCLAKTRVFDSAGLVRVQIPASQLGGMGIPLAHVAAEEKVNADLLVGQDGIARAVRLVDGHVQ
jgi:DNA-directed RNA polymerase specialized sigma24 family protein